jgi:hypothetical protein
MSFAGTRILNEQIVQLTWIFFPMFVRHMFMRCQMHMWNEHPFCICDLIQTFAPVTKIHKHSLRKEEETTEDFVFLWSGTVSIRTLTQHSGARCIVLFWSEEEEEEEEEFLSDRLWRRCLETKRFIGSHEEQQ